MSSKSSSALERRAPIVLRVPATSGNLGPGFDALGLALNVFNEVRAERAAAWSMTTEGEGADLPEAGGNLIHDAYNAGFARRGQTPVPLSVHVRGAIPVARGMGSSAAAIAAGLTLAARLTRPKLSLDEVIAEATRLEGHPDNVLPALVGGITCGVMSGDDVTWMKLSDGRTLDVVILVPSVQLTTKKARGVLPRKITMADAVFNLSRAALLAGALARGDHATLGVALSDRLHQPYRAPLVPGLEQALTEARKFGAHGAYLSGAGPSIALLFPAGRAQRALGKLRRAFPDHRPLALTVARGGAWSDA